MVLKSMDEGSSRSLEPPTIKNYDSLKLPRIGASFSAMVVSLRRISTMEGSLLWGFSYSGKEMYWDNLLIQLRINLLS